MCSRQFLQDNKLLDACFLHVLNAWLPWEFYKIMQPDLSSISRGMQVQHHCSEHSTGFQWRLGVGFNTKLLVSVFSVSIRTVYHHIFLTFFIHTIPLGGCALLTPLCWQFLTFLFRSLEKDLCCWTHCLELFTTIPQKQHSVSQLSKET